MRNTIIFIFMGWTIGLQAQFKVSGQVTDLNDQPVPFVTVALLHPADSSVVDGAIGNDQGAFQLLNVPAGTYRLLIRSVGYKELVKPNVSISESGTLGTFRLQEQVNALEEVVVTGARSTIETQLGKKVLNIGADLSTAGATVTEALQRIPSVSTDMNGTISIRGSSNVIIYVNGKETQRDSKSLQFLSAGALQKIEVITNPSAKYDAGGVGGIINLVFKKEGKGEYKLEARAAITSPYRLSTGLNAQVSSQKLTGYVSGNLSRSDYENREENVRLNDAGPLQRYENLVLNEGKGRTTQLTAGLTYDIDTSFSLNFEYNYWRWLDVEDRIQSNQFLYTNQPDLNLQLFNWGRELEDEMSLSFSLSKEWSKERSLKMLFNGGGEVEGNDARYNEQGLVLEDTPLSQTISSSAETERQSLYQLTVDYTSPLKGFGNVEMGLKWDHIRYRIAQDLNFVSDALFLPRNDFKLAFEKYAAYFIHKMEWDHFSYGIGLRLEHFTSEARQLTTDEAFIQEVTRLFPSVQLVYRASAQHQFAFNYSRRINRPGFFDLNPFVSFTDPLILETGNPSLEPEFANNYELSYQFSQNSFSLDLTGFQRNTTNVIQETVAAFDEDRLLYSYANFGKRLNRGLELNLNMNPMPVLELTGSFSWYFTRFQEGSDDLVVRFNNQSTWQFNLQQRLNLKGNWSLELTENYRAPRIGIQTEDQAYYFINAAVRKSFSNKRAIITLNFQDIFDTQVFKTELRGEDFGVSNLFKFQSRRVTLELRYKLFD